MCTQSFFSLLDLRFCGSFLLLDALGSSFFLLLDALGSSFFGLFCLLCGGLFPLLCLCSRGCFYLFGVFLRRFFSLFVFYPCEQFAVLGEFRGFLFLFSRFFGAFGLRRARFRRLRAVRRTAPAADERARRDDGDQTWERFSQKCRPFNRSPTHSGSGAATRSS